MLEGDIHRTHVLSGLPEYLHLAGRPNVADHGNTTKLVPPAFPLTWQGHRVTCTAELDGTPSPLFGWSFLRTWQEDLHRQVTVLLHAGAQAAERAAAPGEDAPLRCQRQRVRAAACALPPDLPASELDRQVAFCAHGPLPSAGELYRLRQRYATSAVSTSVNVLRRCMLSTRKPLFDLHVIIRAPEDH